jgi:membrane-associated phospholipid phosphatase
LASLFIFSDTWNLIDTHFFHFVNHPLKDNSFLRTLWALASHSLADWFEDLCFLCFYIAAILKTPRGLRLRRGAELFFCVLLTAITIILINRLFCRDFLHVRRASPSLVIDQMVNITQYISWIEFKVHSSKSLPGDHATTALMLSITYAYLVRGRLALLALVYGAFLCLPRLAVGAHWLSDIVVGSGCIVMISISWAFFTPFADKVISAIERRLKKIWKVKVAAG